MTIIVVCAAFFERDRSVRLFIVTFQTKYRYGTTVPYALFISLAPTVGIL
jgi:hypothetical protein